MTFKNWLKNSKYKDQDPLSVLILNCSWNNLTDLKGIEIFKNLEELDCSYNKLTSLKGIEKLNNLKELFYYDNNLEHKNYYGYFNSIKDYQQYLKSFYRSERIKNLI